MHIVRYTNTYLEIRVCKLVWKMTLDASAERPSPTRTLNKLKKVLLFVQKKKSYSDHAHKLDVICWLMEKSSSQLIIVPSLGSSKLDLLYKLAGGLLEILSIINHGTYSELIFQTHDNKLKKLTAFLSLIS